MRKERGGSGSGRAGRSPVRTLDKFVLQNMEELMNVLESTLNIDFIRGTISGPRNRDGIIKVKIRPLEKKGELYFQLESFTKTQAFHENAGCGEAKEIIAEYMKTFRQMQIETVSENISVLTSKKGKITIQRKKRQTPGKAADLSHNRKKKYILEEGVYVPFLKDLGVMTEEGKIVASRRDKFRQINRFLEFIRDILPELDRDRELTILDFGCGKSYLTFAMYYYLHELKNYDIQIIGLDLKKDVIEHCSSLGRKYGYEKLKFLQGDIADYDGVSAVDMVVTLHACDTATDYALAKAVGWNAKIILSVPCCQHELNGQLSAEKESVPDGNGPDGRCVLRPVMDYGLLKERFAALLTDGLRAKYLEDCGYETQILEFIDMEHTPKNILIRAVNKGEINGKAAREIKQCEEFLRVKPALGALLAGQGEMTHNEEKTD